MVAMVWTRLVSHSILEHIVHCVHSCALLCTLVHLRTQYCQKCLNVHNFACLVTICNILCLFVHFCSFWPGASVEIWKWANLSNQPSVWDEPNDTLYR